MKKILMKFLFRLNLRNVPEPIARKFLSQAIQSEEISLTVQYNPESKFLVEEFLAFFETLKYFLYKSGRFNTIGTNYRPFILHN